MKGSDLIGVVGMKDSRPITNSQTVKRGFKDLTAVIEETLYVSTSDCQGHFRIFLQLYPPAVVRRLYSSNNE